MGVGCDPRREEQTLRYSPRKEEKALGYGPVREEQVSGMALRGKVVVYEKVKDSSLTWLPYEYSWTLKLQTV